MSLAHSGVYMNVSDPPDAAVILALLISRPRLLLLVLISLY